MLKFTEVIEIFSETIFSKQPVIHMHFIGLTWHVHL